MRSWSSTATPIMVRSSSTRSASSATSRTFCPSEAVMSGLSGKTALVTGALTGIGRPTEFAFAQEGSRVVVSGRRDDAGQALVTELRALGAEAEFVRADVRREDDVRNLVNKTVARFGRLEVAVNNAGTEGQPGPLTEQSAETYAATTGTAKPLEIEPSCPLV